ncbi:MAG: type II secretion system secretin GspD [Acidobacteriia bacterium]|nr:type II secretion system secretin GspD [Terriglobia bacterium]
MHKKFLIGMVLWGGLICLAFSSAMAQSQQEQKPPAQGAAQDKKSGKEEPPKKKMKKVHTLFGDVWVEDTGEPEQPNSGLKPEPPVAVPPGSPSQPSADQTPKPPAGAPIAVPQPPQSKPKPETEGIQQPAPGEKKPETPSPPSAPGSTQVPAATPSQAAPHPPSSPPITGASLVFNNADLIQVVQVIANLLHLNYVLDPGVKGIVTITTMGDISSADLMQILQTLLRINGATAIQTGNLWQIVPLKSVHQIPIRMERPGEKPLSPGDEMVTEVVPMQFVAAADMSKLLKEFLSDAGSIVSHDRGNILILTDASRNMSRLLDLIRTFDSDVLQNQRLQLFTVKNNSARSVIEDLKSIFSAYAMSDKDSAIRFVPLDRLNAILAVAPNPASFDVVEQWIDKLDQPSQIAGIRNYVYHLQYAKATVIRGLLGELYGSVITKEAPIALRSDANAGGAPSPTAGMSPSTILAQGTPQEKTQQKEREVYGFQGNIKIVADETNNMLIIQATPQDYDLIEQTLHQIDILPLQVLIEAQIFRVDLSHDFSLGIEYALQQRGTAPGGTTPLADFTGGVLSGSMVIINAGARELFAKVTASENRTRAKTLAAPSILVSDNQEARIQVGVSIPTLSSSGFSPGSTTTVFNTVQNVDTGVILAVTPHVNASGLVGLKVTQEVSSPVPPPAGVPNISPSINRASASTTFVIKDGETMAIAGIITEDKELTRSRIPLLGDIPFVGAAFGSTNWTNKRSELIIFITPHVVTTLDQAKVTSDSFKEEMKGLSSEIRNKARAHHAAWDKAPPPAPPLTQP